MAPLTGTTIVGRGPIGGPIGGTTGGYDGTTGVFNTFDATTGDPVTDGVNGTPRVSSETRDANVATLPVVLL